MGKLLSHEDKMKQDSKGESNKKNGLALVVGDQKKNEQESFRISNPQFLDSRFITSRYD